MSQFFENQDMCKKVVLEDPEMMEYLPDGYKTQHMCERVVLEDRRILEFVADQYKTHGYVKNVMTGGLYALAYVFDQYNTQQMCEITVLQDQYQTPVQQTLEFVPDQNKKQEMCNKIMEESFFNLLYIFDYYATQEICSKAVEAEPQLL